MKQLIKAKVRWYDNNIGEGYIRLPDNTSVYVHKTAIAGTPELAQNETVYVTVHEDYNWIQIDALIKQSEVA